MNWQVTKPNGRRESGKGYREGRRKDETSLWRRNEEISFRDRLGITLGSFWDHLGIVLASFGIFLGLLGLARLG